MLGAIDDFRYNILLLTHFFATFYVAVDAVLAVKLIFFTLFGYFYITCITLLYSDPRPYWESD